MAVAGVIWAMVGLLHSGNFRVGVVDAFRIYVVWSVAFLVLYSFLRSKPSLVLFHTSMVKPSTTVALRFLAPRKPGEYPSLCTYPGHWLIMRGVMIVE